MERYGGAGGPVSAKSRPKRSTSEPLDVANKLQLINQTRDRQMRPNSMLRPSILSDSFTLEAVGGDRVLDRRVMLLRSPWPKLRRSGRVSGKRTQHRRALQATPRWKLPFLAEKRQVKNGAFTDRPAADRTDRIVAHTGHRMIPGQKALGQPSGSSSSQPCTALHGNRNLA